MPDSDFLRDLRPVLEQALADTHQDTFELVSATEAATACPDEDRENTVGFPKDCPIRWQLLLREKIRNT